LFKVDPVLGQEQSDRMRGAGAQAEAGHLAAATATEASTERVARDAQYAVQQVLGAQLGRAAFSGGGTGDELGPLDQVWRATQRAALGPTKLMLDTAHGSLCGISG
jgi:hypothetical protein